MNTTHATPNTRLLKTLVVGLVLLSLALAYASQLVHEHFANAPVDRNISAVTIHTFKPETLIRTDEGLPRAREDVVRMAIADSRGSGSPAVPANESQIKISSRATDAEMIRFLRQTNLNQLASVYREVSQMIDSRHVSPPSYEERTRGAIAAVAAALQNETFLRTHNINNPQMIQNVISQLQQMAASQPARDANSAVAVMQMVAETANRSLGVRREAIALEFVNGTLDSLDRYSAFMPETAGSGSGADLHNVRTAASGLKENMVGIGVELKAHTQGMEVVDVIEGGPAAQLGMLPGDIIVAINQQNIAGETLNQAADRLVGASGSPVTLEIVRNNSRFRGTVVRRQFYVSSVTGSKLLEGTNSVGYVRLKQFSSSTAEDLEKALWTLHRQGMQGLVIDLRGNPGGLLDECVDISNMFLPSGVIVSPKGRNSSDNSQERATAEKTWSHPLIVLVDENSASASEIFAAAVQENLRGVIVGRTSYGKGTVQTHFPMRTVSATLKLTTAKFYSPRGREMAGAGVTPDVAVNASALGTRGTTQDADLQMAIRIFAEGTPTNLAARFGGRSDNPFRSLQTNPLTNTMPNGYGQPNQQWTPGYQNFPQVPQQPAHWQAQPQPANHNWQLTDRGITEI